MTEMQHQPETEKVAMTNTSYMVVRKPLSLAEDHEVQRTRKILIIILGVCLGLCVGSLVGGVFGSELPVEMNAVRGIPQIGPAIIAILFFGFGTLAARRYSTTGLRVFAWLNIIELVLMVICIVILIIAMIMGYAAISTSMIGMIIGYAAISTLITGMIIGYAAISTLITGMVIGVNVQLFIGSAGAQNEGFVAGLTAGIFIFILLICIASFVVSVIIVKLTFKLVRAIDANQRLIIQQA